MPSTAQFFRIFHLISPRLLVLSSWECLWRRFLIMKEATFASHYFEPSGFNVKPLFLGLFVQKASKKLNHSSASPFAVIFFHSYYVHLPPEYCAVDTDSCQPCWFSLFCQRKRQRWALDAESSLNGMETRPRVELRTNCSEEVITRLLFVLSSSKN